MTKSGRGRTVRRDRFSSLCLLFCHLFLWLGAFSAMASSPIVQQHFQLVPGWNAIWLEVQPADNSSDRVFGGLPVASVWTRAERLSSVDFIQDPSEQLFNEPGWLGWFHPSRPEAFLGNLFTVQANRAYLIRLTNSAPVNWSVIGRPSLRAAQWVPDAYNLRGLPVDPAAPPTFLSFFRPSPAHYDSATGRLQKIYRLSGGQWTLVAPGDTIASGEAYWIYTKGASDYVAPLQVSVDLGDGLDYGLELTELNLRLANRTSTSINATVQESDQSGPAALSYFQFHPTLGGQWPALSAPLAVLSAAGSETRLRLAARRQNIGGASYASILRIRDGVGTRILVPVSAEAFTGPAGGGSGSIQPASTGPDRHAGLWIGSATLNAVSEVHSVNPTVPTPTKSQMSLRLLLHVDNNGQSRLLKEVIQMMADGTYTNDPSGVPVQASPPRVVLVTDDRLIGQFQPIAVRDGQLVGRRFSSATFDFDGGSTNVLPLTGAFGGSNTLRGTIVLVPNAPTNPFRHKYHPDHDNLDATFRNASTEAYTVVRAFDLIFSETGPANEPDYGYNTIGGTYRESIAGLSKNDIVVRGDFTLTRVATTGVLNQ